MDNQNNEIPDLKTPLLIDPPSGSSKATKEMIQQILPGAGSPHQIPELKYTDMPENIASCSPKLNEQATEDKLDRLREISDTLSSKDDNQNAMEEFSDDRNSDDSTSQTVETELSDVKKTPKRKLFDSLMDKISARLTDLKELDLACDKIITSSEAVNQKFSPAESCNSADDFDETKMRELLEENHQLKIDIEEYRIGLELIMQKYRENVTAKVLEDHIDFCGAYDAELWQTIGKQRAQIHEMAEIMKKAAKMDEEEDFKIIEELSYLRMENKCLRELVDISKEFGSFEQPIRTNGRPTMDKAVQTDAE